MIKVDITNSPKLSLQNGNLPFGAWIWYSVEDVFDITRICVY